MNSLSLMYILLRCLYKGEFDRYCAVVTTDVEETSPGLFVVEGYYTFSIFIIQSWHTVVKEPTKLPLKCIKGFPADKSLIVLFRPSYKSSCFFLFFSFILQHVDAHNFISRFEL